MNDRAWVTISNAEGLAWEDNAARGRMAETVWPVVVVGAGAAGLVAAIFAAEGGQRVLLLERTDRPGQKILIAGGGRCNVLPAQVHTGVFETDSPREALEAALAAWPLDQQTRFFEHTLGVRLKREDFPTVFTPPYPGLVMTSRFGGPGKLFPVSDQARQVRDALLDEARRRGVTLWTNASIEKIERLKTQDWRLEIVHHPSSNRQSSHPPVLHPPPAPRHGGSSVFRPCLDPRSLPAFPHAPRAPLPGRHESQYAAVDGRAGRWRLAPAVPARVFD